MKKLISVMLSLLMLLGCIGFTALADNALSASVYVTVANKGDLAVTCEKVTVTDIDDDGALTVNDALYAAHEEKYEGGAAAGYGFYTHADYGLSLGKLWGDDSGSFGYYLNNASALSLADTVKEGDSVYAFVYSDTDTWSDTYCFFDVNSATVKVGEEVSITLSMAGYDADFNPVISPLECAMITVDGQKTELVTDKDGKVTVTLSKKGTHTVSAVSDALTLIPPVCVATALAEPSYTLFIYIAVGLIIALALVVAVLYIKKKYEK